MRHLNILLNRPSKADVRKVIEFWDSSKAFHLLTDPFDSNAVAVEAVEKETRQQRRELQQKREAEYECDNQIKLLQQQLNSLERVLENEAERFRLEAEIYRLEQERDRESDGDEWPDVIETVQS